MTERTPFEQIQWRLVHTNPVTWDTKVVASEVAALSEIERGGILGPLWRDHLGGDAEPRQLHWLAGYLDSVSATSDRGMPLFDGTAADVAFASLAHNLSKPVPRAYQRPEQIHWTPEQGWRSRIGYCAAKVCMRLVEEPGNAGKAALSELLKADAINGPLATLIAARLTGEIEREKGLIRALIDKTDGPIARAEINALLAAPVLEWSTILQHYDRSVVATFIEDIREVTPNDLPAYRTFAKQAVSDALALVRAIHSGAEPYKADKLLSQPDAHAVGRAMQLALSEDLPWGIDALEEIWRGTAYAPYPKAKTLPSQTLTYQIGHAVIAEPRPEAVLLMQEIAKTVRHASVKKKMAKFAKQALTALSRRPERLLDTAAEGPLPPELAKFLKPALEGLLLRDWDMEAGVWAAQMTDKTLWPLASKLIWQVDELTGRPTRKGETLSWVANTGDTFAFDPRARIRLWHPLDADEATRGAWRKTIAEDGKPQPFAQAFREIYPLNAKERDDTLTEMFAKTRVAQVPMIGLARRIDFRLGFHDEIDLTLSGQRFRFFSGVRTYPGAGGEGMTGPITLLGPAKTLGEVPPRILSEAMRRFDLIISVGAAGVDNSAAVKHPHTFQEVFPGGQSIAMRRALLDLTRPAATFDGRWLLLADDIRIHLGTGRMLRNGTPIELAQSPKAKSTPRADDKVMDKIWAALTEVGLA